MKRQAWQDFRLRLVISHSLVAGQLYSMFPVSRQIALPGALLGPHPPARDWTGINRPDLHHPPRRGSHRAVVLKEGALRYLPKCVQLSYIWRPQLPSLGGPGTHSFEE